MKSIYTIYKERLIEISGKSRSIYSKKGIIYTYYNVINIVCNKELNNS